MELNSAPFVLNLCTNWVARCELIDFSLRQDPNIEQGKYDPGQKNIQDAHQGCDLMSKDGKGDSCQFLKFSLYTGWCTVKNRCHWFFHENLAR